MTWVTDGSGTRWVPHVPRKRRKPPRALRFANLKAGDILLHRSRYVSEHWDPPAFTAAVAGNDNRRTVVNETVGFAIAEHRWFDPVRGESDPVAGEMVGVRHLTSRGPHACLWPHTLRGLASNGYHPLPEADGAKVRRWMADRDELIRRHGAGEITAEEARAAHLPWRALLRAIGLE